MSKAAERLREITWRLEYAADEHTSLEALAQAVKEEAATLRTFIGYLDGRIPVKPHKSEKEHDDDGHYTGSVFIASIASVEARDEGSYRKAFTKLQDLIDQRDGRKMPE